MRRLVQTSLDQRRQPRLQRLAQPAAPVPEVDVLHHLLADGRCAPRCRPRPARPGSRPCRSPQCRQKFASSAATTDRAITGAISSMLTHSCSITCPAAHVRPSCRGKERNRQRNDTHDRNHPSHSPAPRQCATTPPARRAEGSIGFRAGLARACHRAIDLSPRDRVKSACILLSSHLATGRSTALRPNGCPLRPAPSENQADSHPCRQMRPKSDAAATRQPAVRHNSGLGSSPRSAP
jgi:hypothetical protein